MFLKVECLRCGGVWWAGSHHMHWDGKRWRTKWRLETKRGTLVRERLHAGVCCADRNAIILSRNV